MSSEEYLDKMKKIQEQLLLFIDDEKNTEENFQNLKDIFINTKIKDNRYELVSLLHLILQIGNYHYRFNNLANLSKLLHFSKKISRIITRILKYSIYLRVTKGFFFF